METFRNGMLYCPICGHTVKSSDHLAKVFKNNQRRRWLANMITHYRHTHITSWNKYWGYNGWYYREASHFGDYDEEKKKVNERAKREILHKAFDFMMSIGITVDDVKALQGTEPYTIAVYERSIEAGRYVRIRRKDIEDSYVS